MIQSGQGWDGGIQREGLTHLEGQGRLPGGGDCELSFEEKAQVGETNTVLVGVQGGILSRRACGARSPEMEAVLGTQLCWAGS